jgi:hypothetical protein
MKIVLPILRTVTMLLSFLLLLTMIAQAQKDPHYKSFKLSPNGDTLNILDSKGLKQGKWVINVPPIRGENGYDEEGEFIDDKKEGVWRQYASSGDIVGVENYRYGGKDGLQQYYTYVGVLVREEEWHSVNPDAPYDTIAIYGVDNGNIIGYKIVRATQYSVPNGDWKFYDDQTGDLVSQVHYDYGRLVNPDGSTVTNGIPQQPATASTDSTATKKPPANTKTPEMLEYEKKYSKKKRTHMEQSGQTGL